MKNESTNRRKKLPLLLGALLIISVAAYGTRAYFSDSAKVQANIELELGNVDISTEDTKGWKYTPITEAADVTIDGEYVENTELVASFDEAGYITTTEITNVRPGDSFTREFVITNNGTLDIKLNTLSAVDSIKATDSTSPVKVEIKEFPQDTILAPTKSANYTVTITIDPQMGNGYNNNGSEYFDEALFQELALDYTEQNLNVEATQTNKK